MQYKILKRTNYCFYLGNYNLFNIFYKLTKENNMKKIITMSILFILLFSSIVFGGKGSSPMDDEVKNPYTSTHQSETR